MSKTMKKMPAILLAGLIAVVVAFAIGTFTAQEAYADEHSHDGWTAWTSNSSLPESEGNYYLTDNVTLSETWFHNNGTVSLCLNGKSITMASGGDAINITSNCILNLYNCGTAGTITHASGQTGSGVLINGGTFNMYGGTISGNEATDGGGVLVQSGTFNMSGGTISGNEATVFGGGVWVQSGTFNMSGGTISENRATDGGGIYVNTKGFNMSGGTITENTASSTGGGIFVAVNGMIQLSGSPQITGNTANGKASNMYFGRNAIAEITGELNTPERATKPQIGVSVRDPGVFTSGLKNNLPSGKTASDLFFSDDSNYALKETTDGEAQLVGVAAMNGDGTKTSPYEITSYEDLKEFASIVNGTHPRVSQNTAACGKLMDKIQCNDKNWTPIGTQSNPYIGHFDGNNMIIEGLSNERSGSGADYQGLFGYIGKQSDAVKGEVKNVVLEGGKIIGKNTVGGVAGWNGGMITNCCNSGAVSGSYFVGGVAGRNYGGTITTCYNSGAVNGDYDVGGVAGFTIARGGITNCYNTGVVSGTGDYVGGVAGIIIAGGEVTNCYNSGAVSGNSEVGGVAGSVDNGGTITNCYYDKTFSTVPTAIGEDFGTVWNVDGLDTSKMTGSSAIGENHMDFSYAAGETDPWLMKPNGIDGASGEYYEYYPHLKGFAYDSDPVAANWPAKPHVHKVGDKKVYFTSWVKTDQLPDKAGSYCLTGDVSLTEAWNVPGTVSLCLNDHSITYTGTSNSSVIKIAADDAALDLYDCGDTTRYYYLDANGRGHVVASEADDDYSNAEDAQKGTFEGGFITGGKSSDGGGVYIGHRANFTMNCGSIIGSYALHGGGVHIENGGDFTMNGGSIIANTASSGGGVHSDGDFTMNGGNIISNRASNYGGGVYVNSYTETFGLSGASVIIGNKADMSGGAGDVYLRNEKKIVITGKLQPPKGVTTPQIGVTMQTPSVFTSGYSDKNPGEDPGKYFVSNDDSYAVCFNEGVTEAQLVARTDISAGTCSFDEATYSGEEISPQIMTLKLSDTDVRELKLDTDYKITNYKDSNDADMGTAKPKYVGTYKATVEGIGKYKGNEVVTFTIKQAPPTIETAPTASAITYGQTLADSTLTGGLAKAGTAEVPGTFAWKDKTIKPEVTDSDKTEYDVIFTPTDTTTYKAVTTKVKLTVNKAPLTIKAIDQSLVYNGSKQGPGDMAYDDPEEIAKVVKVGKLQGSDKLISVEVDGQGEDAGDYDLIPNDAAIGTDGELNANYDITYVNGTLTIEPAPLTATVNGSSAIEVYNEKEQTYTGTVTATSGDTDFNASKFSYTGSKVVKGTNADVYTTKLNEKECVYSDKNYKVTWTIGDPIQLTINKADITPTVSIEGWTYGSAANTPSVEGNPGGGEVTFWYKEKEAPDTAYTDKVPTDAGTYTVKADIAETENYNAGSATLDFTISPADLQVTSSGFDGDFDGGDHSITVNAPEGADVYYAGPGGSFNADNPTFTTAGTYAVDFKVMRKNYKEYDGTETVVIHQATNTVTVSIEGWTYGEPAHIPTVEAKFGADKATLAYSDAPDGSYQPGGPDQAGIWYVKATVPETKDYTRAESQPTAFEIAKAKITIAADDKTSLCGKDMAELTYTLSGAYVEGDELGIALSTDADQNKPGTYPIKVSWNENPNYNATLVNGTYKVTGISDAEKKAARIALDAGLKGTSAKGTVTAKWGKVKKADKYVVYATYCGVNKKCKKIRTVSGETTKVEIKKLAGKKLNLKRSVKYYVVAYRTVEGKSMKLARSRTVHVVGSGNENASNIKSIKVKKRSYKLKPGETAKIKARLVLYKKDKKPLGHAAEFRYDTSNEKVAKVSENGKIKAVGAGKCKIYVYAQNGCAKKINVTVK